MVLPNLNQTNARFTSTTGKDGGLVFNEILIYVYHKIFTSIFVSIYTSVFVSYPYLDLEGSKFFNML